MGVPAPPDELIQSDWPGRTQGSPDPSPFGPQPNSTTTPVSDFLSVEAQQPKGSVLHRAVQGVENYILSRKTLGTFAEKQHEADIQHNYATLGMKLLFEGELTEEEVLKAEGMRKTLSRNPFITETTAEKMAGFASGVYDFGVNKAGPAAAAGAGTAAVGFAAGGPVGAAAGFKLGFGTGLAHMFSRDAVGASLMDSFLDAQSVAREVDTDALRTSTAAQYGAYFLLFYGGLKPFGKFLGNAFKGGGGAAAIKGAINKKLQQVGTGPLAKLLTGTAAGTAVMSYFSAGGAVIDDMANAAAEELIHGDPDKAARAALSRILPQRVDPKTGRVLEEFELGDEKTRDKSKLRVPALSAAADAVVDNFAHNVAFAGTLGLFPAGWAVLKQNMNRAAMRRSMNTMVSSEDMVSLRDFTKKLQDVGVKPGQIESSISDMVASAPKESRVIHVPRDRWVDYFQKSRDHNFDPVTAMEKYLDIPREQAERLMTRPEIEVPLDKFMGRGLTGKDADFMMVWGRNNVRAESIGEVMEAKGKEPKPEPIVEQIEIEAEPPPQPPKRVPDGAPRRVMVNELDAGLEIPVIEKVDQLISKSNAGKVKKALKNLEAAEKEFKENEQIKQMAERAKEVEAEIERGAKEILEAKDKDPVSAAWSIIAFGELPSGKRVGKNLVTKIERESIESVMGKEWTSENIPEALTGKKPTNAITLDEAASLFGFPGTKEFALALGRSGNPREVARSLSEGTVIQGRGFESAQEAAMDGWDFTIKRNAIKFNETMFNVLADAENVRARKILTKEAPKFPRRMDLDALRNEKAEAYEDVTLGEIRGLKYKEVLEQRRQANNAAEADANADISGMMEGIENQTRAQVGQEYLANLKTTGEKSLSFLRKQVKKERAKSRGRADERLSQLADEVLFRVGLREEASSLKDINQEIASIAEENGIPLEAPRLFGKGLFRELADIPANDLIEAASFVKQLNTLARGMNEIQSQGRKVTMAEFVESFAESVEKNLGIKFDRTEDGGIARVPQMTATEAAKISKKLEAAVRAGDEFAIPQFRLQQLDGGEPNGLMSNTLRVPIVDGLTNATRAEIAMVSEFQSAFKKLKTKSARKNRFTTSSGREFTLEERVTLTAMRGSKHAELSAKEAFGLTNEDMIEISDSLTRKEIEVVKDIYNVYEKNWKTISDAEFKNTGIRPERAETKPFLTKHGWVDGGFVPLAYGNVISKKGQVSTATVLDNQFPIRQMTKPGHLRARTKPPVAGMLRLDFGIHTKYAREMMHDAHTRAPLANASRILHNPDVVNGLSRIYGLDAVKDLQNWVKTTAMNRIPTPRGNIFENIAMKGMHGITAATIPLNPRAALSQISGLPVAARDIGGIRPIFEVTAEVIRTIHEEGDPGKLFSNMAKNHVEEPRLASRIEGRADQAVVELQNALSDIDPRAWRDKPYMLNPRILENGVRSYKYFTGYMQGLVDHIIYEAAKREAMAGKFKNIDPSDARAVSRFAFDVVERSQGSGEVEFLSPVQRKGSVFTRAFSMFSTPLWAMLNQKMDIAIDNFNRAKSGRMNEISKKDIPKNIGLIMATLFGSSMIYSALHDDLDSWFDVVAGPVEEVPVIGEIAGSIKHGAKTGQFRGRADTPLSDWTAHMTNFANAAIKRFMEDEKKLKKRKKGKDKPIAGRKLKQAIRAISVIPGFPSTIPANFISIFWDVKNGNIKKDMSSGEILLRSMLTGATKETEPEKR